MLQAAAAALDGGRLLRALLSGLVPCLRWDWKVRCPRVQEGGWRHQRKPRNGGGTQKGLATKLVMGSRSRSGQGPHREAVVSDAANRTPVIGDDHVVNVHRSFVLLDQLAAC